MTTLALAFALVSPCLLVAPAARAQEPPTEKEAANIDAQTMAAVLVDYATNPVYRAAVKREFDGLKALFGEYQSALRRVYVRPVVPDPE